MNISWLEQTETDVPAENQWLSVKEMSRLAAMPIPKRRADWRLGRWTAKQAVAAILNLRTSLANIEIRPAPSGAPEVFLHDQPAEIAISLSHRDGTALCSVAPLGTIFGCDLELIEPRSDAFVADYFTADEKAFIQQTAMSERSRLLALLWSGKESALKALRVGLRLDTTCMSVRLDGCFEGKGQEWRPLQVHYSAGQVFGGWWRLQNNLVRTVVSDPPLPTPLQLRIASVSEARTVPSSS
jgi:4'-phosphopantetheinyl transferase